MPNDEGAALENKLNDLTGSEWLYWTNTLYETNFPPDPTHSQRKIHGAMKPPELMAEIIRFFSKQGELILDPFAGVGGTLLGAQLAERRAMGIELNPCWVERYQYIIHHYQIHDGQIIPGFRELVDDEKDYSMIQGDCIEMMRNFADGSFAAIITDPPYGCHHGRIGFKKETNFNMVNPNEERDFGNAESYEMFFDKMKLFGREAYRILKEGRYLILLIGDRYYQGEYFPLGVRVAETLKEAGFRWKGIRIWWNKATQRPLRPYAIKRCFIPNITHQNILIMRKEN